MRQPVCTGSNNRQNCNSFAYCAAVLKTVAVLRSNQDSHHLLIIIIIIIIFIIIIIIKLPDQAIASTPSAPHHLLERLLAAAHGICQRGHHQKTLPAKHSCAQAFLSQPH
jgi:hypothetical protein